MNFKDKVLKCTKCGTDFVFGVDEQRRMAAGGEVVESQICLACQANRDRDGRLTGYVKWFDARKGYGFIMRDDGGGEVFVHYSDIQYPGFKVLYEGERVEFDLEHDPRGEKAINVTGHDVFAP